MEGKFKLKGFQTPPTKPGGGSVVGAQQARLGAPGRRADPPRGGGRAPSFSICSRPSRGPQACTAALRASSTLGSAQPATEGSRLCADVLGAAWALRGNGVQQAVPWRQSLVWLPTCQLFSRLSRWHRWDALGRLLYCLLCKTSINHLADNELWAGVAGCVCAFLCVYLPLSGIEPLLSARMPPADTENDRGDRSECVQICFLPWRMGMGKPVSLASRAQQLLCVTLHLD